MGEVLCREELYGISLCFIFPEEPSLLEATLKKNQDSSVLPQGAIERGLQAACDHSSRAPIFLGYVQGVIMGRNRHDA